MRLFTGIAVPEEAQQALAEWTNRLREKFPGMRWSAPEQWHVTLQFLGSTEETRYACIVERLHEIQAQAVEIEMDEPGFFERAGVFHLTVKATTSLLALHRQSEQALAACGFEPEPRAYSPHITLARRKGRRPSPEFEQLRKSIRSLRADKLPSFSAREFLLYESITDPAGSQYKVRERFPLM